jgi:tetratricopeptide (TPR) repeat protein
MKNYDKAIGDYGEAIRVDPNSALAHTARGEAWGEKKDYGRAIADYREALQLDPSSADALNGAAWWMATCPDEQFRDEKKAVELAMKACEISGWSDSNNIDTLAAAYAEVGDFESAMKYANKAITLDPNDDELKQHLALFKDHKAFHEQ